MRPSRVVLPPGVVMVLRTAAGDLRLRCVVPGGSPYAVLDVALPEGARLELIEEASTETGRGPQDVRAASPEPARDQRRANQ